VTVRRSRSRESSRSPAGQETALDEDPTSIVQALAHEVSADAVAAALLARFSEQLCEKAVCLRTSVPNRVALTEVGLPVVVKRFIERFDPTAAKLGLYVHQAEVLRPLSTGEMHDTLLTSATGSGKSLALWGFLVQAVTARSDSTALACFPTQALLWGQVERLRRASDPESLVDYQGQSYAGTVRLGRETIPWTAWHGVSDSVTMARHEQSESFRQARIRVTTVDKVHWSLMKEEHAAFLSRLAALAMDEAHAWHGAVGANVRAMLNRLHASMELHRKGRPGLFLASATLSEPAAFAAQLTGRRAKDFHHVDDGGATQATEVPAATIPCLIRQAKEEDSLLRFVLLLSPLPSRISAQTILEDQAILKGSKGALCFVQSKFAGHRMGRDLAQRVPTRQTLVYDGDLPPQERRSIEQQFLNEAPHGRTIIGTSALELGVDLPDLDLVLMDQLPARKPELLQRLGRVGRRAGSPGLCVLCLDHSPFAQRLVDSPASALSTGAVTGMSLPLHLEHVRLRAMRAFLAECAWKLKTRTVRSAEVDQALLHAFGESPTEKELDQRIEERIGDLVDRRDKQWPYQGFRPSLTSGKHPLIRRDTGQGVALINGGSIYRDAHPEGIYLAHNGERFRVVSYRTKPSRRKAGNKVVSSASFLESLDEIVVDPEPRQVATRGKWREHVQLVEKLLPVVTGGRSPSSAIEYGKWEWSRRFDGYDEYDLNGKGTPREVPLSEVVTRYRAAAETGDAMPFLPEQRYRTLGWRCKLGESIPIGPLGSAVATAINALLAAHFCAAVECSSDDLQTLLLPKTAELLVLDRAPSGSGLSEAVLRPSILNTIFVLVEQEVRRFIGQPEEWFFLFLNERGRCPIAVSPEEVARGLSRIAILLYVCE
jgi:superfamily II DNA/RNA helicase